MQYRVHPPPNRPLNREPPNVNKHPLPPPPNRPLNRQPPPSNLPLNRQPPNANALPPPPNLPLNNRQPPNANKPVLKEPHTTKSNNIIKPITISLILGALFIILNTFILIIFSNYSTINNIITSFIGVFIVIFLFLICIIYIIVLNGKKIKNALKKIAIIMAITFGVTLLLLVFSMNGKYPFINVFENSVGYLFCSLIYGKSLNKLFKFKENLFNNIEQFQPNKTVLLTLFTLENFDNLYETFIDTNNNYTFTIDNSDISIIGNNDSNELKTYLKNIVSYKNTIGILSWFYITSFFTTLVSIKYLSSV